MSVDFKQIEIYIIFFTSVAVIIAIFIRIGHARQCSLKNPKNKCVPNFGPTDRKVEVDFGVALLKKFDSKHETKMMEMVEETKKMTKLEETYRMTNLEETNRMTKLDETNRMTKLEETNRMTKLEETKKMTKLEETKRMTKLEETMTKMKTTMTKIQSENQIVQYTKEFKQIQAQFNLLQSIFQYPSKNEKVFHKQERIHSRICKEPMIESLEIDSKSNSTNCTAVPSINKSVSVLINLADQTCNLTNLVRKIGQAYPNISILIATSDSHHLTLKEESVLLKLVVLDKNDSFLQAKGWNSLISKVETPFAFLARDLMDFTLDARLDRLIMEAENQNADVVGGAVRNGFGHWDVGCFQTIHKNYSLDYFPGYHYSRNGCLYCNYLAGPFIIRTKTLRHFGFTNVMSDHLLFEDFFFRLSYKHRRVSYSLLCPDSMFFVKDNPKKYAKEAWSKTEDLYELNKVRLPTGEILEFGNNMTCPYEKSRVLPRCCVQNLADMIKVIIRACQHEGFLCELQDGTLLGAVKFGGILPWERDADVTIAVMNMTNWFQLLPHLEKEDYFMSTHAWCCYNGRPVPTGTVHGNPWQVELFGQHMMDSEKLLSRGYPPTKVSLNGVWVPAPHNPGLYVRNRYGPNIYRHSISWLYSESHSNFAIYNISRFPECKKQRNQGCLDQYSTDGNIQFRDS